MISSLHHCFKPNKKIGIFGYGVSGKGAAYLCEKEHLAYDIVDENIAEMLAPHFEHYHLCVFSPGFSQQHRWWKTANSLNIPCVTELDFAASFSTSPIFAVTGTNGKTSTVTLLTQLLQLCGHPAIDVGNNGRVLSKAIADEILPTNGIFVCEVSSFQAVALNYLHPACTLFTNIAIDHLNYHKNFENYLAAKLHLLSLTDGPIICGNNLKFFVKNYKNTYFSPPINEIQSWLDLFPTCCASGQRENFALIKTFADVYHIPTDFLNSCLQRFTPPPHRLHCCYTNERIEFWNDSKATNLHAVQAALQSFENKKKVRFILGGKSKGEDLQNFVKTFNRYPEVECIYLIGETGKELAEKAKQFHAQTIYCETLENVFKILKAIKNPNFCIVFSPGFSSFDQFTSFEHRGDVFEQLVHQNFAQHI